MPTHEIAGSDGALLSACARLGQMAATYRQVCAEEEPLDRAGDDAGLATLRVRLWQLQEKRQTVVIAASALPTCTAAGLQAKAAALLIALDNLDPAPELDLARSLARDVLAAGRS